MTMLTVSVTAAALLTLVIAKITADANRAKAALVAAKAKRGVPRVAGMLVAVSLVTLGGAVGVALTYATA